LPWLSKVGDKRLFCYFGTQVNSHALRPQLPPERAMIGLTVNSLQLFFFSSITPLISAQPIGVAPDGHCNPSSDLQTTLTSGGFTGLPSHHRNTIHKPPIAVNRMRIALLLFS